jgi:hypothetical protein
MGEKPATEVELTDLQDKWLIHKDDEAYQKMFGIIVQYARSIILKMTRGKKFLNPDYVFNMAVDSAIKFFEQYTKNPNFRIDYSFAGVLRYKVLECLYGPKIQKQDAIGSINAYVNNFNDTEELESLQEKLDMRPYWSSTLDIDDPIHKMYHTEETTLQTVMSVINDVYKSGITNRDNIIILIALLHTFRKNKNLELFKEMYLDTSELKDIYELTLLEIRNRLSEEV